MSEVIKSVEINSSMGANKPLPIDEEKALKGWYFFDWANQAYALTVMTVIAPALMASLYNQATGTQSGDTFYATVLTLSMLFVVATAPALGVIADKMPIKKKLLKWYTVAGIAFTALMGAAPYLVQMAILSLQSCLPLVQLDLLVVTSSIIHSCRIWVKEKIKTRSQPGATCMDLWEDQCS